MNEITFYLLKSILSSGVMYLGYRLWLSNNQAVGLMRWYLLSSFVLPLLFPLVNLTDFFPGQDLPVVKVAVLTEVSIVGENQDAIANNWLSYRGLYLLVSALLVFLLFFRLFQIVFLISRSKSVKVFNVRLHLSLQNLTPFSFFNNILVSRQLMRQGHLRPVIIHEMAHIRQGHSYDVIFVELMSILLWFNPFVWLFRKAVRQNHEFLADRAVLKQQCNPANYKALLLESLTGISVPVVNNFNHSSLKKRFIMLNKPFSGRIAKLKAISGVIFLSVIATVAITFLQKDSFALVQGSLDTDLLNSKVSADFPEVSSPIESVAPASDDTTLFQVVEQMPEFPGGKEAFAEYLSKNIEYPEQARKKGITGSVYVNFVVETDGSISGTKVQRGIGSGCDEAALKTIRLMPKWKPGMQRGKAVRVSMTVPVRFSLSGAKFGQKAKPEQMKPDENGVFHVVEVMPEFPGGDEARMEFLRNNVVYPEAARKAGVQGTVYVTFVVKEDGSIAEPKILRGIDKECDEVVLNMIKKMPKWEPGTQKGKPVMVQFNMPVKFSLSKDKEK
jgi:TonB family protein